MIHSFSVAPLARPELLVSGEWLICHAVCVCRAVTPLAECYLYSLRSSLPAGLTAPSLRLAWISALSAELTDHLSEHLIASNCLSGCINIEFSGYKKKSLYVWNLTKAERHGYLSVWQLVCSTPDCLTCWLVDLTESFPRMPVALPAPLAAKRGKLSVL